MDIHPDDRWELLGYDEVLIMQEFLKTLLKTLNQIEVRGKDNVNYLLGCICAIEKVLNDMETQEEKTDG